MYVCVYGCIYVRTYVCMYIVLFSQLTLINISSPLVAVMVTLCFLTGRSVFLYSAYIYMNLIYIYIYIYIYEPHISKG